jgi:hypothetical protein
VQVQADRQRAATVLRVDGRFVLIHLDDAYAEEGLAWVDEDRLEKAP